MTVAYKLSGCKSADQIQLEQKNTAPNDKGKRKLSDHFLLARTFCLRLKLLNYSMRENFGSGKFCIQFVCGLEAVAAVATAMNAPLLPQIRRILFASELFSFIFFSLPQNARKPLLSLISVPLFRCMRTVKNMKLLYR